MFQTKEQVDWGMWVPQGLPRTLIPPGGHATLALRAATLLTGVEAALTYSVSPEGAGEGAQAFLRIVHNGVNKPLGVWVSRHDIAAVWVAFFSRWQRYRC